MSLLPDLESLLRSVGYRIIQHSAAPFLVEFEDHSLFGFVAEYDSIPDLLKGWKKAEELFLTVHAPSIRRADQKAWNCYSVHITSAVATESESRSLLAIEEDFKSTRKIARAALSSRKDLIHALGPLLPLHSFVTPERQVLQPDLHSRLHEWPPAAVEALLGDSTAADILTLLMGAK